MFNERERRCPVDPAVAGDPLAVASGVAIVEVSVRSVSEREDEEPRGKPMGPATQQTYCVFNQSSKSFVALNVHRLDTTLARLNSALRRIRTKSDEGFWVPSRGIHLVGLLAPVDLIYLDAQNRVIEVVEQMSAFRIGPLLWNSAGVLSLPRHTIYSSQTHVGDQLLICLPGEMEAWLKMAFPSISGASGVLHEQESARSDGGRPEPRPETVEDRAASRATTPDAEK